MVPLSKPNIRKKGTLITKGLRRNLELHLDKVPEGPPRILSSYGYEGEPGQLTSEQWPLVVRSLGLGFKVWVVGIRAVEIMRRGL